MELRLVTDVDPTTVEPVLDFEGFFARQSATLFRRLWLVTRDEAEAEDIVQEAFIVVLERWERVQATEVILRVKRRLSSDTEGTREWPRCKGLTSQSPSSKSGRICSLPRYAMGSLVPRRRTSRHRCEHRRRPFARPGRSSTALTS
jgi:hypothetical protein